MQPPNLVNQDALPWSGFEHTCVRDLAWCLFSPSLIAPSFSRYAPDARPAPADAIATLSRLDRNPTSLQEWMATCASRRLGFRFEHFWHFWWSQRQTECDECLYNFQLNLGGKTAGELDAISWYPQRRTVVHTELAVKFYLGIDSAQLPPERRSTDRLSWVGPGIQDRLDLKWQQLEQRQLTRLRDSAAQQLLPSHWHWERLQTQAIVRGRLYFPLHYLLDNRLGDWSLLAPDYLNPNHLSGYWLSLRQLAELDLQACLSTGVPGGKRPLAWVILERDQWFASLRVSRELFSQTPSKLLANQEQLLVQLSAHFKHYRQPLQFALLEFCETHWCERIRCFVVPDHWPGSTVP